MSAQDPEGNETSGGPAAVAAPQDAPANPASAPPAVPSKPVPVYEEPKNEFDGPAPAQAADAAKPGTQPAEFGDLPTSTVGSAGDLFAAEVERKRDIDKVLFGIFVLSIIEVIQAAIECGDKNNKYGCTKSFGFAVALGIVSILITFSTLALSKRANPLAEKSTPLVSFFLMVWWGFGVAITTFNDPFTEVGNGWCATWGTFLLAVHLTSISVDKFKQISVAMKLRAEAHNQETRCLTMIFALSGVLFYACILESAKDEEDGTVGNCGEVDKKGNEIFGILLSAVTLGMILIFKFLKTCQIRNGGKMWFKVLYLALMLSGAWSFGAVLLTFSGPFKQAGNGWIASWGVAFASYFLVFVTYFYGDDQQEGIPEDPQSQMMR